MICDKTRVQLYDMKTNSKLQHATDRKSMSRQINKAVILCFMFEEMISLNQIRTKLINPIKLN